MNALSGTLERLVINPTHTSIQVETDRAYGGDQEGLKFATDLIKFFERLTVLFLPLSLFLGWDVYQQPLSKVLPTSTRALILRDCILENLSRTAGQGRYRTC
jgi:hypothetical protein